MQRLFRLKRLFLFKRLRFFMISLLIMAASGCVPEKLSTPISKQEPIGLAVNLGSANYVSSDAKVSASNLISLAAVIGGASETILDEKHFSAALPGFRFNSHLKTQLLATLRQAGYSNLVPLPIPVRLIAIDGCDQCQQQTAKLLTISHQHHLHWLITVSPTAGTINRGNNDFSMGVYGYGIAYNHELFIHEDRNFLSYGINIYQVTPKALNLKVAQAHLMEKNTNNKHAKYPKSLSGLPLQQQQQLIHWLKDSATTATTQSLLNALS